MPKQLPPENTPPEDPRLELLRQMSANLEAMVLVTERLCQAVRDLDINIDTRLQSLAGRL